MVLILTAASGLYNRKPSSPPPTRTTEHPREGVIRRARAQRYGDGEPRSIGSAVREAEKLAVRPAAVDCVEQAQKDLGDAQRANEEGKPGIANACAHAARRGLDALYPFQGRTKDLVGFIDAHEGDAQSGFFTRAVSSERIASARASLQHCLDVQAGLQVEIENVVQASA